MVAMALLLSMLTGWAAPVLAASAHPVAEVGPSQARQEQPDESTTSSVTAPPDQDIIPAPNSGQAPREAGERGGALQLGLFALIVAGIGLIVWRIVLSARRSQA